MPDKTASSPAGNGRAVLAVVLVLVILVPVGYSVFARVTSTGAEPPERPHPMYLECIRPTEHMRFHHWELLKGMREDVVRDGNRGKLVPVKTKPEGEEQILISEVEQSLDGCWHCHTSKERFCDRCHDAAFVRPDCFGCHYDPDLDETHLER